MSERKIAYEAHPVSPERKAELRAAGFKIVDAAFAPAEHRAPREPTAPAVKAPTARRTKE